MGKGGVIISHVTKAGLEGSAPFENLHGDERAEHNERRAGPHTSAGTTPLLSRRAVRWRVFGCDFICDSSAATKSGAGLEAPKNVPNAGLNGGECLNGCGNPREKSCQLYR